MTADGTINYTSQEPFERVVQAIRNSLRSHGMRVAGETDVSRRLARSLGIILAPRKVIFVLPAFTALSGQTIHPWAAVFLPLHIVISGNDVQSEIRIPNTLRMAENTAVPMRYGPIVEAQRQLIEAIEPVAVRPSVLA
jgi:uncharacterized protein (DUF302 family)